MKHIRIVIWIAKSVYEQRLSKHVTTQTTMGETVMEYINTWLHSNIKSNDEKLLNYTNEACINTPPQTSVIPRAVIQK
jgi:hemerythrin